MATSDDRQFTVQVLLEKYLLHLRFVFLFLFSKDTKALNSLTKAYLTISRLTQTSNPSLEVGVEMSWAKLSFDSIIIGLLRVRIQ